MKKETIGNHESRLRNKEAKTMIRIRIVLGVQNGLNCFRMHNSVHRGFSIRSSLVWKRVYNELSPWIQIIIIIQWFRLSALHEFVLYSALCIVSLILYDVVRSNDDFLRQGQLFETIRYNFTTRNSLNKFYLNLPDIKDDISWFFERINWHSLDLKNQHIW